MDFQFGDSGRHDFQYLPCPVCLFPEFLHLYLSPSSILAILSENETQPLCSFSSLSTGGCASFLISLGILIRRSLSQVVKTCYTSPSWRDDDEADFPCAVAYSAFGEKSRRRLAVLWRRALLSYFFAISLLFSFTFFPFFFQYNIMFWRLQYLSQRNSLNFRTLSESRIGFPS